MANAKRIHSITIKRMIDENPDTGYLGEYSSSAESNYSIDRKHSLDCASQTYNVTVEGIRTLKHAISYLLDAYLHGRWPSDSEYVDDCQDAVDILGEALDATGECDCGERGDMERNEYRYFNPYVERYKGELDSDIRKYVRQDYERMESLHAGNWGYLGVIAEAEIGIPTISHLNMTPFERTSTTIQHITSGGLWGIESDSDAEYLESIEKEQLTELREQLAGIGFSKRAISAALKNVERKDY